MSETGHDFHALFPEHDALLHRLKIESTRFRELAGRHHDLMLAIQRIEAGLVAASDERIEELKKERLHLLDEVAGMIAAQGAE